MTHRISGMHPIARRTGKVAGKTGCYVVLTMASSIRWWASSAFCFAISSCVFSPAPDARNPQALD
eukprot:1541650-Rhodomonas_salina.5